jgi:hypothetical protein
MLLDQFGDLVGHGVVGTGIGMHDIGGDRLVQGARRWYCSVRSSTGSRSA